MANSMNAFEFEITLQSQSGENSWPIVVRCKQPDGLTTHAQETLKLTQEDFNRLTQYQENEKEYGTLLGKALFQGSVGQTFVRAFSKNGPDCLLRVLLAIEAGENDPIKTLHWERLCAPIEADGSWQVLVRDQRVPFSLYIPTIVDRRFPPIGRRDLRCLILVASPSNLGKYQLTPFDVEGVLKGVKTALGEIPYAILANNIEGALGPPTLQELSKQLTHAEKPYTLLHFVCHGKFLASGETVLYWATQDDEVLPVPGEELLKELKNIGNHQRSLPHFTFLCSCETADPRAEGALGGLAQRLVRQLGMPAVVAMTRKVSVETALVLGQNFYQRLRESGEVDLALQEATAGLGKRHDITVPALFSRLGGRPLFSDRLDNRELTDEEIDYGIEKLKLLLQERSPNAAVLKRRFEKQVKILKNTRGAESRNAKEERTQALVEIDGLCEQVLEIGFEAIAALGKAPPDYKAECPFPGLSSFGEKRYHKFFFGRDELIKNLQKELAKDTFLAVIGTSGSGKSSVVLAGLIPLLKEEEPDLRWAYLTPTRDPIAQLDKRLEILSKSGDRPTVLVVDQFEEVFTLCDNKEIRQEFIQKLLKFAQRQKVVITMRADFLGECTFYPDLRKRIETRQKLVGPMEASELVIAMKMQADSAGLRFEAGLSNAILNEVKGEPGAMPLLQYALQELWKRRHGRWLCDEEYQAIGGVQQAIAKTANDFYHNLPEFEQQQLQNIFLRLTRLDETAGSGDKRRDTRRRVDLEDLVTSESDLDGTKKLVQQLAGEGARLVVTSRNETTNRLEVEVAHEALIRHWPLLQEWLDQNRNDLQLRESIARAASDWQKHQEQLDRDVYLIHHGGRLEDAESLWKQPRSVRLNPLETEYVGACVELRDRLRKQEQQRRQRQLFAAAIAAFICGGFAIFASYEWRKAEIKEIEAFLVVVESRLATHQGLDARISSIKAQKLLNKSFWQKLWPQRGLENKVLSKLYQSVYSGPELNLLKKEEGKILALAVSPSGRLATGGSDGIANIWDPSGKLLYKLQASEKSKDFGSQDVNGVAFNPEGTLLATAPDVGAARLWDTEGNEVAKLEGHDGPVIHVVFSPDGKLVATGGSDGTARLWDTEGKELAQLRGHEDWVNSLVFSPDGRFLATGGIDGTARLWNTSGQQLGQLPGHEGGVSTVTFSPDGRFLATAGYDGTARIWDSSGKQLQEFKENKEDVSSVTFSPDGQLLATAADDGIVRLWNTAGKQLGQLRGHQGSIYRVTFSPDGKLLATGGSDGTARLWDTFGNQLATLKGHQGGVRNMAFSPDGSLLITSGYERTARIWQIFNEILQTFTLLEGRVNSLEFSSDASLLAISTDAMGPPTVRIWDASSKQLIDLQGYKESVRVLKFSPDGNLFATVGAEGSARLWDTSGKEVATLKGHEGPVYRIAFSPDGRFLATLGEDGSARLWDTSGKEVDRLNGQEEPIYSMAFSPDGRFLAMGGEEGNIRLWDTSSKEVATVKGHEGPVMSIKFSPDGNLFATGEYEGKIRLWDSSGKEVATVKGHEDPVDSLAFSPDGRFLVTSDAERNFRIWDTSANQLAPLQGSKGSFRTVAFSPDGNFLATGGDAGDVRIVDISGKQKEVATVKGHEGQVISMVFSPDGNLLATGGEDGITRLWDSSGEPVATLDGHEYWVNTLAFSPDGNFLVSGGLDGSVRVGPIGDLNQIRSLNCAWLKTYLNNPNPALALSDIDRQLCDDINPPDNPPTDP
ncbi:CHAT domain-containing protein [Laspinema sp. D1]|uniref:nSTAND1 domain-containing NTPase n=1 Tax=Laspinema palackyanum TaxID=3231601 RepID=UPI003487DC86|nr:CHAT domain-containing protein [Laspinema sp. D2b]